MSIKLFTNVVRAKWHVFAVATNRIRLCPLSSIDAQSLVWLVVTVREGKEGRKGGRGSCLLARLAAKQVLWMIAHNINGHQRAGEEVKAGRGHGETSKSADYIGRFVT